MGVAAVVAVVALAIGVPFAIYEAIPARAAVNSKPAEAIKPLPNQPAAVRAPVTQQAETPVETPPIPVIRQSPPSTPPFEPPPDLPRRPGDGPPPGAPPGRPFPGGPPGPRP
jgi:hypothetical protein